MSPTRRGLLAGLAGAGAAARAHAAPLGYTLTPQQVGDGLWVVRGADAPITFENGGAIANITIAATSAGAVLVDTGPSLRFGQALKALAERLVGKPVVRIYLTHLHPDHVYGTAAFDPRVIAATPKLLEVLKSDEPGFAEGMYRLLGGWMAGTEPQLPTVMLNADHETIGGRTFRLMPLSGHSPADLALLDVCTQVLIAGDLVFHDRAPSTPHADLGAWLRALDGLDGLPHRAVIPGHGPVDPTPHAAIAQTRDWLQWLDSALHEAVASNLDMAEAGDMPIPSRFAQVAAARYELQRSVSHFYPRIEAEMLPRIDARASAATGG